MSSITTTNIKTEKSILVKVIDSKKEINDILTQFISNTSPEKCYNKLQSLIKLIKITLEEDSKLQINQKSLNKKLKITRHYKRAPLKTPFSDPDIKNNDVLANDEDDQNKKIDHLINKFQKKVKELKDGYKLKEIVFIIKMGNLENKIKEYEKVIFDTYYKPKQKMTIENKNKIEKIIKQILLKESNNVNNKFININESTSNANTNSVSPFNLTYVELPKRNVINKQKFLNQEKINYNKLIKNKLKGENDESLNEKNLFNNSCKVFYKNKLVKSIEKNNYTVSSCNTNCNCDYKGDDELSKFQYYQKNRYTPDKANFLIDSNYYFIKNTINSFDKKVIPPYTFKKINDNYFSAFGIKKDHKNIY